jgi:hypothetical protein
MSAEQALTDAFVLVGFRHATEPEMLNAARLHSNWCNEHLRALQPAVERYGVKRSREGERLRRALFHGRGLGGYGLLRDVHDFITLATFVHASWMAVLQAAREARDADLEQVSHTCDTETLRHISWLETQLRQAAPQALTVQSPLYGNSAPRYRLRGADTGSGLHLPSPTCRLVQLANLSPECCESSALRHVPSR